MHVTRFFRRPATPTPALFWWVVAGSVVAAMVPTLWPAIDLNLATPFSGSAIGGNGGGAPALDAVNWWWVTWINAYIPGAFRFALLLAAVGWAVSAWKFSNRRWSAALAFVLFAGIAGPGAVVNLGFKDNWHRARPYQVEQFGGAVQFSRAAVLSDQCDNNCSFVSGHVSCGFFLAGLMLVQPRRRRWWAATGVVAGLVIGFARMADMAHWFSDVLWACPITLLTSWLVWQMLLRVYTLESRDAAESAQPASTVG